MMSVLLNGDTTHVTSGAGTEFTLVFSGVRIAQSLVFCVLLFS